MNADKMKYSEVERKLKKQDALKMMKWMGFHY